jgi:hypothetical protein
MLLKAAASLAIASLEMSLYAKPAPQDRF